MPHRVLRPDRIDSDQVHVIEERPMTVAGAGPEHNTPEPAHVDDAQSDLKVRRQRVDVNTDHPLAWGMPEKGLVVFFGGSQVYEVARSSDGEGSRRVASYIDRDILQSGQLDGEDLIANRAAMLSVDHGEGQVVLIGFRPQHRAQTHGTYKFLFNALVGH